MAKAVTGEPAASAGTGARAFRGRFLIGYAVLGIVAGAAIAAALLIAGRDTSSGPAWSPWQPSASGLDGAREIAAYVGAQYRLDDGHQLLAVQAGPPEVQSVPINAIAIRPEASVGSTIGQISVYPATSSVVYALCGLGKDCSIASGKASAARGVLVRREALELALYSFKYLDGVDSVISFLPPPKGKTATLASYFRKDDYEAELDRPLSATLAPAAPAPAAITSGQAAEVDRLVLPRVFRYAFQRLQDGSTVMVLDPLSGL